MAAGIVFSGEPEPYFSSKNSLRKKYALGNRGAEIDGSVQR